MESRATICGSTNQRSRTATLIQGVATEIRISPHTIGAHAILAHCTARCWSSPSVFMTSQHAPSST